MKRLWTFAILIFAAVFLAACGGSDAADDNAQNDEPAELIIQVEKADDINLADFENLHDFHIREDGAKLVIWANMTLANFSVAWLAGDFVNDELVFTVHNYAAYTQTINVGEAAVLRYYMGQGTLPHMGVSFDAGGVRRYFIVQQSMMDGQWRISEFEPWTGDMANLPNNGQPVAEISEYGRQVATNFLANFDSLFTPVFSMVYGWDFEREIGYATGIYSAWDASSEELLTTENPDILFTLNAEWQIEFLDANRNRITNVPWIVGDNFANYFHLFDFDGSGIPDILVHFQQTFDGGYGGFYRIFRYFDGAYVMLEMVTFVDGAIRDWTHFGAIHELFLAEDGRIIAHLNSEYSGFEISHIVFNGRQAEFYMMPLPNFDWEEWTRHHWERWEETPRGWERIDSWAFHNPTLFGTDIRIEPLRSFEQLGEEIWDYLMHNRN